jgi:aspartate kinase
MVSKSAMSTVVMKFGGSSVADLDKLKAVARQVVARKRQGDRVVVVVSAMGKSTDALIAQARQVVPEPPRRELDMLVTAGERIAMALLSMAIFGEGEEAMSFTGSQSGIITEDQHQGARIIEVRPARVEEALEGGRIAIVAGFQGVSRKREITTLGRGGSDTTAVALAAALNAQACEIYSDVDGVYSADPNVVPDAQLLPELRYEPMQAMAAFGAKVLNADAVEFARKAGIAIFARQTGDVSGRQTVVSAEADSSTGILAVAGAAAVTLGRGPCKDVGGLLGAAQERGARPMIVSVADLTTVLFDRTGVAGKDPAVVAALCERYGLTARAVALVTLVGMGLSSRPQMIERALAALARNSITPAGMFAVDSALSFVVEVAECDAAVRLLHTELVAARPAAA